MENAELLDNENMMVKVLAVYNNCSKGETEAEACSLEMRKRVLERRNSTKYQKEPHWRK